MAANLWLLRTICKPLGVSEVPRGRPLVRFRLTEVDNAALAALLQEHLRPMGDAPPRLAAVFCLFAVDVLRRRPPGGAWAWQDITDPLRASDIPQSALRLLVAKGMDFWQRPLRVNASGDRLFLGSLVIEAGVPAALLARAEFGEFLRQIQSDIDVYSAAGLQAVYKLAEQGAHRLPGVWRNDETIALASELLWALQPVRDVWLRTRALPQHGDLANWRDNLPLDMAEEVAARLIERLVRQERITERKLPELSALCSRVLVRRGEAWTQRLAPADPGVLPQRITSGIPFSGADHPDRVRVVLDGIALAVAEREGAARWTWQPIPAPPARWSFDRPADARLLVDGQERERLVLPGGEPVDDLPWVLEPYPTASDRIAFVGQGSHSTPGSALYVAVDPSLGSFDDRNGTVAPCGPVEGTARVVHMVSGDVLWRESGEPLAMRLRTDTDAASQPRIVIDAPAPQWAVEATLASLGSPRVATAGNTGTGHLMWRPRRGQWARMAGPLPPGECDIALVDRGEILDRRRLVVLPARASVTYHAREAEVRIEGLGHTDAVLLDPPGSAERDGPVTILRVAFEDLAPGSVLVQTRMPDGQDLRHRVRVPLAGGGFIGADGRAMPRNATITFPDLRSMLARAGAGDDRAELGASLTVQVPRPLRLGRSYAFVDELPMARLLPEMRRLYATGDDRDAEIRLTVRRSGMDGRTVRVGAFDVAVTFSPDKMRVDLRDRAQRPVRRIGEIAVLSLTRPDQPLRALDRDGDGWALPGAGDGGPWLVIGMGALSFRVRPSIWPGSAAGESPSGTLACAAAIPAPAERRAAYEGALHAMSRAALAPGSMPEWQFLTAVLAAAERHAPPIFFDALARAAECPLLLVHWLLRADAQQLSRLAALEDELPFAWCLVPLSSWHEALLAQLDFYRGYGLNYAKVLSDRLGEIAALCPAAVAGVWQARETLMEAAGSECPPSPSHLRRAMLPAAAPFLEGYKDPPVDCDAWRRDLEVCGDWENLPGDLERAAPHVAAHFATGDDVPAPIIIRAIRFCRQKAPDAFDTRFGHAVLLRLAKS